MTRRLIVGVTLASVAALSMTGCGGSSKTKANDAGPEVTWAGHVCDGLGSSISTLRFPTVDPKDSAKSKQSLVDFFKGLSTDLTAERTSLSAAGAPPVANGQQTLTTALTNLSNTQAAVSKAATDLSAANVTDAKSLQAAMTRAGQVMAQFQNYQGPTKDLRANPSLNTAFNRASSCLSRKM